MTNPTFQDFLPQGNEIPALQDQVSSGKMSHAILISGESGTGKRTLARVISSALLCSDKELRPCGKCSSCIRAYENEHPDLITIEKGIPLTNDTRKNKTTIPIDDIREMIRLCSAYPMEGGNRVIIIANAEDMTIQAQNCLLKILEEPPEDTYFLLTTAHPEKILVTVRSRCRNLKMRPWDEKQIVRILTASGTDPVKAQLAAEASHGSIGYAKQLADDETFWKMRSDIIMSFFRSDERSQILSISSCWKDNKANADILFNTLEECVRSMLQYRIGNIAEEALDVFSDKWKCFAAEAAIERFLFLMKRISESRKQHESNVSIQAIVEQLLLSFMGEI